MAMFFLKGKEVAHGSEREEETKILSNKWNRYKQEIGWISRAFMRLSKKSQSQKVTHCECIYITFVQWQNCSDEEQRSGCQGLGLGRRCGCHEGVCFVMEQFCILNVVMVMCIDICDKISQKHTTQKHSGPYTSDVKIGKI